ncbi:hypothetical protein F0U44_16340 [Nocardioides humilatus]|uniref:Uncharacterized protein n=1 Tax=Nocardioides humilatus TaxID=2607660 RepID=A0A5B1L870_9ACTN|nr:hypothetical protein [Nocardioides humilatus]KAA1416765.1 hypothetical protein F0U44_16340 [Nocardioides humilatus]
MFRRLLRFVLGSVLAASSTLAVVALAPPAHASPTTFEFTGLGDGTSWNDQMNWSPQGIPHSLDSIVIRQQPGGPVNVTGAVPTTLAGITVEAGGSIDGQPLNAATVHWTGGTIYNEITALNLLQVDGPNLKKLESKDTSDPHAGKLIIEDQALISDGELRTIKGTIVNNGTLASVGGPSSSVLVNGNFGSSAKGTFVNDGTVTASSGTTIQLRNFNLEVAGLLGGGPPGFNGGTVQVSGTALHLTTTAAIDDHVVIDDATVTMAEGNVSLRSGSTLTVAGSASTTLAGAPRFTGTGTLQWLAGTVTGKGSLASGVTMSVEGVGPHKIDAPAVSPFTVEPGAVVVQRGGPVSLGIHTTVTNQGRWRVRDASSTITGLSCCVPGSTAIFDNVGTVEVQAGKTLTLGSPGIDFRQRTAGGIIADGAAGGRVVMLGGDSELMGGHVTGVELVLGGNSAVELSGTINIDAGAAVRQTDSTDVTGTATFGGAGTYRWSDGTITGDLIFGSSLTLKIDDPDAPGANKALLPDATTGGSLDVRGPSTIATTLPILVSSTSSKLSTIVNKGTMKWTTGTIDSTGVAGTFTNVGTLQVAPGAEAPATERLDASFVNKGTVELTKRGQLTITGAFTQTQAGTTRLSVAGKTATTRDRLAVGGALKLDGTLALRRKGTQPISGYTLIAGASRSGKFDKVTGLGGFPAGYHVGYSATGVKLLA